MGRRKSRRTGSSVSKIAASPARANWPGLKHLVTGVALGILTLLAYSNSFNAGFVKDSKFIILDDSRVHQATSENIDLIFHHTYWWPQIETGLYRPVTTFSYLLNYAILGGGDQPEGYHWINFLLHFVNVLLVYALCLRLLRKFWLAVFVAALWAVHPVLAESVTNIVGRADLLAGLAVLSGLLMYLKSTDHADWRRYVWLVGLMAVTAMGVFSKESAVAILGVIVLYEITFWKERRQLAGLGLGCAAVGIPIFAMLYERTKVLAAAAPAVHPFLDNPLYGASFLKARLTAIATIARYLWIFVWPANLSSDYSYSQIPVASGTLRDYIAWSVVLALVVICAFQFRKNRLYFFFGAFAFVTFVPTSNLLFLAGTIMAERFLYLPSVGLAACAVMAIFNAAERFRLRTLAPITLCILVAGFGIRTWVRNVDWHDELGMAEASVRTSPNSFRTHITLAGLLGKADPSGSNISQVIDETETSIAILNSLPDALQQPDVYAMAGSAYEFKGTRLTRRDAEGKVVVPQESVDAYKKSIQLLLRGIEIDKARALASHGQLDANGKITPISADAPKLYEQLAITYFRLGDFENAYNAAVHARSLDPSELQNYLIIGQQLVREGRKDDAAVVYVEGTLVSESGRFLSPLEALYRTGIDTGGCAIRRSPNGDTLNTECAPVHLEICRASAELNQLYRDSLRQDLADAVKSKAATQFNCAQDRLR